MMIELGNNITKILIHIVDSTAIVCSAYFFAKGVAKLINDTLD